jgi:predicted alpha-1,2-mannosidase
MNVTYSFSLSVVALIISACCSAQNAPGNTALTKHPEAHNLKLPLDGFQYVNPFIGTGGHGHTYPGATAPFGMVQLSPDTRLEGWDGCGGYHYDDEYIYGFSHTHLQGTGVPDYCDILLMPTNHRIKTADKWNDAYKSKFSHSSEIAQPGYYKVQLDDYNIKAEMTSTDHVGIHRYTFLTPGDSCRMFLDFMHRDGLVRYDFKTYGDTAISGYRISKGWAEEQHTYFYAVFSKPFRDLTQLDVSYNEQRDGKTVTVMEQVQVFSLLFDPTSEITVKVGLSGVDEEGAKRNLTAEAAHWDFDRYRDEVKRQWTNVLAKAPIEETDQEVLANYYTALYHCYTVPNIWSDVDGRYRGEDKQIHTAQGYRRYTVFSLWDTFRAYHPLMSELEPERTRDWIITFLEISQERGELPVWELAGNETYCMIGYHSVPVIYDAYMRGIRDFDLRLALKAMVNSARGPQEEKKRYAELGIVPAQEFSESVSKTLEFAYDDWCIAQFAKELGDTKVYDEFIKRSQNWKHVFDPTSGFMRPRRNGGFPEPFDPYQVDFNYTEANAWQYSLFVPHDIETLIAYHGGKAAFEKWLDSMFSASTKTSGREQSDITGLIGQYAHGNEPSHHAALLYTFVDKPEKTKAMMERICKEQYHNTPDGLCGNEDCGQMSAWYVLAKNNVYSFLPGNKEFINFGGKSRFPSSPAITSAVRDQLIQPMPLISGPQLPFRDSAEITLTAMRGVGNYKIHVEPPHGTRRPIKVHKLNGGETKTITIYDESHIVAFGAENDTQLCTADFYKRQTDRAIVSLTPYNNQYTGGGNDALVDGMRGGADFRTGSWQGWQGQAMECVIDLGKEQNVTTVSLSCLQETKSWIWFPSRIEIQLSQDGKKFTPAGAIDITEYQKEATPSTREFTTNLRGSARYVKVIAKPAFETIPTWHLGAGGKPWIFADEVIVK